MQQYSKQLTSQETVATVVRIAAAFIALLLWLISINFSKTGFDIEVKDLEYVGIILAIAVTVIQLSLGKPGTYENVTLVIIQLSAYAYGIYTNISGISSAQGLQWGWDALTTSPGRFAFASVLGFMLEVAPEPLLIWGLTARADTSDFVANLGRSIDRGLASMAGGGGSGHRHSKHADIMDQSVPAKVNYPNPSFQPGRPGQSMKR